MTTRTRTLVATLAVLAALAGCSAAGDAGSTVQEAGDQAVGGGFESGGLEGGAPRGSDVADEASGSDAQQVVQTARATMVAPDPVAAAHDVVALVTRLDGHVDARYERSGTDPDDPGSATLTLRVPARAMTTLTDDLGGIGEVREFLVETENVTGAAQDLDARIAATELSVARMSDLLARAATSSDIIEAEAALTERQADLERLRSERARLADRVALSTVHVEIHAPDQVPEPVATGPATFLDGLETGWTAFLGTVRGALVVVGVLLPWLVAGALVAAVVLLVRRRRGPRAAPAAVGTAPVDPPQDPAPRA
ncbi:DUF4349 domain-containing protein [Cellulomonas phragmiteti]|uniref:DUF4349 domain-containing protein n=1 Tax=Cellulomonas phragmiteti TaxID=478780 RepID=A0ABQ4DJQ7_9CELL|nr:DUF4349 domain-containing protein [Cellulomonas phragmiteti]GIG39560.1 hypothetical protein Cph01nite_13220 [Cellulomonas phragmiteti]